MSARKRHSSLLTVVPTPDEGSTMGQWAAFLFQTCPGTWQDVADALGTNPESARTNARVRSRAMGVAWPLEKCPETPDSAVSGPSGASAGPDLAVSAPESAENGRFSPYSGRFSGDPADVRRRRR